MERLRMGCFVPHRLMLVLVLVTIHIHESSE